ncbi:mRNA 3'-end-processing protein rna14, partial [Nowakowskiella sp. JEL0407]
MQSKDSESSALEEVRAKIHDDPWNMDSWNEFLNSANKTDDLATIRQAYEELLAQFPSTSKFWISYVEFEQKNKAYDKVEAIFNRCLRPVPSCDLWKSYLSYIRRMHAPGVIPPDRKNEAHAVVEKAFEFVLNNVGSDKESGVIWADYIFFVKSTETTSPFEEQQKNEKMRRIFHRALVTPLSNIEQIWKDYDTFENLLNKQLAKKIVAERSAGYMTARSAVRELRNLFDGIEMMQKSWVVRPPQWTDTESDFMRMWKGLISWEKGNPLKMEDKSIVINRVTFAYKSALLLFRFFPEAWHDAAMYLADNEKLEEAAGILQQGVEILPTSSLLGLALAELEEQRKRDYETVIKPIYEKLINAIENKISETNSFYDKERRKLEEELLALDAKESSSDNNGEGLIDGEEKERERVRKQKREMELDRKVEEKRRREIDNLKKSFTLVWITYMKATRRIQGVKTARVVFSSARKTAHITYHIFVASANMEYYCSKDAKIAGKVFELGLKSFNLSEDEHAANYISLYLDFLIAQNDDNNARALFERALSAIPPSRSRKIWDKLLEFESNYGDLNTLLKTEKRMAETYPEDADSDQKLENVATRWRYLDIDTVGEVELGLIRGENDLAEVSDQAEVEGDETREELEGKPAEDYVEFPKLTNSPPSMPTGRISSPNITSTSSREPMKVEPQTIPVLVPEGISQFLDTLPPAHAYDGQNLPVNDVIELFRQVQIPLPTVAPIMVPIHVLIQSASETKKSVVRIYESDRYKERDRRDWNRNGERRDRGSHRGSRGRGGSGGVKRRSGNHSDEDDYGKYGIPRSVHFSHIPIKDTEMSDQEEGKGIFFIDPCKLSKPIVNCELLSNMEKSSALRMKNLVLEIFPPIGLSSCVEGFAGSGSLLVNGRCVLRNVHPNDNPVTFRGLEVAFLGEVLLKTPKKTERTPLVSDRVLLFDEERSGEVTTLSPGNERYSIEFQFIVPQEIADALPPTLEPRLGINGWTAEVSYRIVARCWGIDNTKAEGEAVIPVVIERHHPGTLRQLTTNKTRNLEVNGSSKGVTFRIRAPKVIIPGSLYEIVYRFEKGHVKKGSEDKLKRIEMILTEKIWINIGSDEEKSIEFKFPMTVEKERCQTTGWERAAKSSFRLPNWSATNEPYTGPMYIEKNRKSDVSKLNLMSMLNPSGDWGPIRIGHSILISVQYKQSGRKQNVFPITVLGATRQGLLNDPEWAHVLETQDKMDAQAVTELNGTTSDEDALNLAMLESFLDPMTQPTTEIDEEKALSNALDQSALMAVFGNDTTVPLGDLLSAKKKPQVQRGSSTASDDLMNAGFTEDEAMYISLHASKFEQKKDEREEDPFNEGGGSSKGKLKSKALANETEQKEKDLSSFEFDFGKFEKPVSVSPALDSTPVASPRPSLNNNVPPSTISAATFSTDDTTFTSTNFPSSSILPSSRANSIPLSSASTSFSIPTQPTSPPQSSYNPFFKNSSPPIAAETPTNPFTAANPLAYQFQSLNNTNNLPLTGTAPLSLTSSPLQLPPNSALLQLQQNMLQAQLNSNMASQIPFHGTTFPAAMATPGEFTVGTLPTVPQQYPVQGQYPVQQQIP